MAFVPLGDDNSDRMTTPVVNYAIIALNVFVFVVLQQMGSNLKFTYAFSAVPAEIVSGHDIQKPDRTVQDPETGQQITVPDLQPTPVTVYLTLLTSIFMHGGLMHLGGNMLFLWIFGDNIEDKLGHGRYLAFYLLGGLAASLAHVFFNAQSEIPTLGASGAISAVLGGYLVLFPKRRVRVLMFRVITEVPAIAAIGLWFVFQLIAGLGSLGGSGDGVAYAAHVGGFVFGLAMIRPFMIGRGGGPPASLDAPPLRPWRRGDV